MTVAHATTTAHAETTAATSRPSYTAPAPRERPVLTDRLASPVLRAAYAGAYDAHMAAGPSSSAALAEDTDSEQGWLDWAQSKLAEGGRAAILAVVRRWSPQLAVLIEQNGVGGTMRAIVTQELDGILNAQLPGLNVTKKVEEVRKNVDDVVSLLKQAASGDPAAHKQLLGSITKALAKLAKLAQLPSIKALDDAFATGIGIAAGVERILSADSLAKVADVLAPLFDQVEAFAAQVIDWAAPVLEPLGRAWSTVCGWLDIDGGDLASVGAWVRRALEPAWDVIQPMFAGVLPTLRTSIATLRSLTPSAFLGAATSLATSAADDFQWLYDHWGDDDLPAKLEKRFGPELSAFTSPLSSLHRKLTGTAQSALDTLRAALGTLAEAVGVAAEAAFGWFNGILTKLKATVQEVEAVAKRFLEFAVDQISLIPARLTALRDTLAWIVVKSPLWVATPPLLFLDIANELWAQLSSDWRLRILKTVLTAVADAIDLATFRPSDTMPIGLWTLMGKGASAFLRRLLADPKDSETLEKASVQIMNIISLNNPDFLLSYGKGFLRGVWSAIVGPFQSLYDLMVFLGDLPSKIDAWWDTMPKALRKSITALREAASALSSGVSSYLASEADFDPAAVVTMFGDLMDALVGAAESIGTTVADAFIGFLEGNAGEGGFTSAGGVLGELIGGLVTEIVLGLVTGGLAAAAKGGHWFVRALLAIREWEDRVLGLLMGLAKPLMKLIEPLTGALSRWLAKGADLGVIEDVVAEIDDVAAAAAGSKRLSGAAIPAELPDDLPDLPTRGVDGPARAGTPDATPAVATPPAAGRLNDAVDTRPATPDAPTAARADTDRAPARTTDETPDHTPDSTPDMAATRAEALDAADDIADELGPDASRAARETIEGPEAQRAAQRAQDDLEADGPAAHAPEKVEEMPEALLAAKAIVAATNAIDTTTPEAVAALGRLRRRYPWIQRFDAEADDWIWLIGSRVEVGQSTDKPTTPGRAPHEGIPMTPDEASARVAARAQDVNAPPLEAWTPDHKAQRWADYQAKHPDQRFTDEDFEEWSRQYDQIGVNSRKGVQAEADVTSDLGVKNNNVGDPIVFGPDITGTVATRPDIVTHHAVGDVKHLTPPADGTGEVVQYYTEQLIAQRNAAKNATPKRKFIVVLTGTPGDPLRRIRPSGPLAGPGGAKPLFLRDESNGAWYVWRGETWVATTREAAEAAFNTP